MSCWDLPLRVCRREKGRKKNNQNQPNDKCLESLKFDMFMNHQSVLTKLLILFIFTIFRFILHQFSFNASCLSKCQSFTSVGLWNHTCNISNSLCRSGTSDKNWEHLLPQKCWVVSCVFLKSVSLEILVLNTIHHLCFRDLVAAALAKQATHGRSLCWRAGKWFQKEKKVLHLCSLIVLVTSRSGRHGIADLLTCCYFVFALNICNGSNQKMTVLLTWAFRNMDCQGCLQI